MKNRKIWITASLICVISGILILGAGRLLGGRPGFYIDASGIHSSYEAAHGRAVQEKGRELEPFERMEIDVDYADIEISLSDRFAVEYYLEGRQKEPVCQVKNGTFTFKEDAHVFLMSFGFFTDTISTEGHEPKYYVKIKIPEDAKLSGAVLHTESGDITADFLKAGRLEIDNEYGDISLNGFEGEKLEIEMESGNLEIGTLKAESSEIDNEYGELMVSDIKGSRLKASQDSGNCYLGSAAVSDLEIENEYGSVEVAAAGGVEAYDLDLYTEYGSVRAGNKNIVQDDYSDEVHYIAKGDGRKKIKIHCESGNIEVK